MAGSRLRLQFTTKCADFDKQIIEVLPCTIIGDSSDETTYIGMQKLIRAFEAAASKNVSKQFFYICKNTDTLKKARNCFLSHQAKQNHSLNSENVKFITATQIKTTLQNNADYIFVDETDELTLEECFFINSKVNNHKIIFTLPTKPGKSKLLLNAVFYPRKALYDKKIFNDAITSFNYTLIRQHLENNDIDTLSGFEDGQTPLHFMAQYYKTADVEDIVIKTIQKAGKGVNATFKENVSPLYIACTHNNVLMVKHLLQHPNIDVNIKVSDQNETSLHVACEHGHTDIVKLLIAKGADIHATFKNGTTTPFDFAIMHGHFACLKLLAMQKAKLTSNNNNLRPFLLVLPYCFADKQTLNTKLISSPEFIKDLIPILIENNILVASRINKDVSQRIVIALILYLILSLALKPEKPLIVTTDENLLIKVNETYNKKITQDTLADFYREDNAACPDDAKGMIPIVMDLLKRKYAKSPTLKM
jgi:hypothetical protein